MCTPVQGSAPPAFVCATRLTPQATQAVPSTDDFSDIRRAMGAERLERSDPERPRTADPRDGGQLPGEDSWDWYTRSVNTLPQGLGMGKVERSAGGVVVRGW